MFKKVYRYRIKNGAYKQMMSDLIYSETAQAIRDGSVCRITDTIFASNKFVKSGYRLSVESLLYQIEIFGSDHEALIWPDLLEEIDERDWIFVKSK